VLRLFTTVPCSSVFVTKIRHQGKNRTNRGWIFNFCKILWKYQNSAT